MTVNIQTITLIDGRKVEAILNVEAVIRSHCALLALAHRWAEQADDANRAGYDEARDALDKCAKELEKEVRG